MIWSDHLRIIPGGPALAGATVTLKRHSDGATIATQVTDAAGFFRFQLDGCPGPCYWEATADGKTRRKSSKSLGPAGTVQLGEAPYLIAALTDGVGSAVMNALAPTNPSGLTVRIATGVAFVKGITYANYTLDDLVLGTAHATLPRIDTVVVEVARIGATDEGRAELKVVAGTAAASPVAPALTQNATVWQFPLANARVNAAQTTIATLTDRRVMLLAAGLSRNPVVTAVGVRTDTSLVALSQVPAAVIGLTAAPVLLAGVVYDVVVEASVQLLVGVNNCLAEIAPYIGTTTEIATYLGHNQTSQTIAITNSHILLGAVGTGAALSCGVMAKKSNGNNAWHLGGVIVATAYPRS